MTTSAGGSDASSRQARYSEPPGGVVRIQGSPWVPEPAVGGGDIVLSSRLSIEPAERSDLMEGGSRRGLVAALRDALLEVPERSQVGERVALRVDLRHVHE